MEYYQMLVSTKLKLTQNAFSMFKMNRL